MINEHPLSMRMYEDIRGWTVPGEVKDQIRTWAREVDLLELKLARMTRAHEENLRIMKAKTRVRKSRKVYPR